MGILQHGTQGAEGCKALRHRPGAKSPLCKRCQIVYNKKLDLLVYFSKYKIMRAVFRRGKDGDAL